MHGLAFNLNNQFCLYFSIFINSKFRGILSFLLAKRKSILTMAFISATELSKANKVVNKETNKNLLISQYDSAYFS